ncbi:hypothetical protein D9M71_480240 [compost metagenome]
MPGLEQLCCSTHQAAGVDAVVIGEIVVFGREQSLDEMGRNVGETDGRTAHLAKLGDQFSVAAVDPQRDLQLDASEGLYRGQAGAKIQKRAAQTEHDCANDCDERPPEELQQAYQGFWASR